MGHRKRLRERFKNEGFENFQKHEILEMILFTVIPRRDTNKIAHELLEKYETISDVFEASPQKLSEVPGVGAAVAEFLSSIPAITNIYFRDKCNYAKQRIVLNNSTLAGEFAVNLMAGKIVENFFIISLDSVKRVKSTDLISEGSEDETYVNTKEVVEIILKKKAHSVILVHNHPNGTLHPSENDIYKTNNIMTVLEGMGICVIDHIIVAGNRFTSMADRGFLDNMHSDAGGFINA